MGRESDRRLLLATVAIALVLLAVAFIVANMRYFDLGEGGEHLGPATYQIAQQLAFVLGVIFVFLMIYVLLNHGRRKAMQVKGSGKASRGMAGYVVLFIILGAMLIFAAVTQGQITPQPTDEDGLPSPPDPADPNQPLVSPGGTGGVMVMVAFLIVIAVLALGGGTRYIRRRPIRLSVASSTLERKRAQAIVDQAVQELFAGEDPRSVVVRTYQRMSRLVSGRLQGPEFLTPRELAAIAELRYAWPSRPTDELTALFEEAWYSDHELSEREKERALRCLQEISDSQRTRRGANGVKAAA